MESDKVELTTIRFERPFTKITLFGARMARVALGQRSGFWRQAKAPVFLAEPRAFSQTRRLAADRVFIASARLCLQPIADFALAFCIEAGIAAEMLAESLHRRRPCRRAQQRWWVSHVATAAFGDIGG